MKENNNVEGKIIYIKKLWWLKINRKSFRKSPLDGATFPYKIKFEYNVNGIKYKKSKFIYWSNDSVNVGDRVIVIYKQSNPSKVLKLVKNK